MDPILLRGMERILITLGAVLFAYLGYRLFLKGKESGPGSLKVESDLLKIVVSGQGPGLFFMAFGAIVLMFSILSGGAKVSESTSLLKSANADYEKALSKINARIAELDTSSRQELLSLQAEVQETKAQSEALYENFRRTELRMEKAPKYSNDKLGKMIEELDYEINILNLKLQELAKKPTQTGISSTAPMPAE